MWTVRKSVFTYSTEFAIKYCSLRVDGYKVEEVRRQESKDGMTLS